MDLTDVSNNVFVSGESQTAGSSHNGEFKGNLYWAMGDAGLLVDEYTAFEEWAQATGQKTLNGALVGFYADPLLTKDGTGLLTDPLKLSTLTEFLLLPSSPAVDRGLDLKTRCGLDTGNLDLYGQAIPQGSAFDIGAHEVVN